MRTREELEKEGKLYMFMDETPSRAADNKAVTINHGEYLVEVFSAGYMDYGIRIQEWQHTGENEGHYVEVFYNPCFYDNQFVNGYSDDDEGKQAFREYLIDEFNAMFEYFTKEEI
jgi:hypothetical protein